MEKVYDCQDVVTVRERCPFKLPIRTIMKTTKKQYIMRKKPGKSRKYISSSDSAVKVKTST